MGTKEIVSNTKQSQTLTETEKEEKNIEEKDSHMIEVLKKENNILKKQLESLNKDNKYNTLLSMLEVLEMQRKKIQSIKKGNKYFFNYIKNILYLDRKYNNDKRKIKFNKNIKR